jgi:hypothetical protein
MLGVISNPMAVWNCGLAKSLFLSNLASKKEETKNIPKDNGQRTTPGPITMNITMSPGPTGLLPAAPKHVGTPKTTAAKTTKPVTSGPRMTKGGSDLNTRRGNTNKPLVKTKTQDFTTELAPNEGTSTCSVGPYKTRSQPNNAESMIDRMVLIGETYVTTTAKKTGSFPETLFKADSNWARRFNGRRYFRCDFEFLFRWHNTISSSGGCYVSVLYNFSDTSTDNGKNMYRNLMRPGVMIDYASGSSAKLTVPFWKENIPADLTAGPSTWFKLVFNGLGFGGKFPGFDGPKIQTWVRATNIQTFGVDELSVNENWLTKKSLAHQPRRFQLGDQKYWLWNDRGVVHYRDMSAGTKVEMTLAEAVNSGYLDNNYLHKGVEIEGVECFPHSLDVEPGNAESEAQSEGIDPGLAIGTGLSQVESALETAALMSLGKPQNISNIQPVDHRLGFTDNCVDGTWRGAVLGRNANPDTHTSPPCDAEDTNIATLCAKEFPMGMSKVQINKPPGTLLGSFAVSPRFHINKSVSTGLFSSKQIKFAPPAFYFYSRSHGWRGDFSFHVKAFKSRFHNCKLRFVLNLYSGTDNSNSKLHQIVKYVDLSESTDFTIKVPYQEIMPYKTQFELVPRISIHTDSFVSASNADVGSEIYLWYFGSWDNIEFIDYGPTRFIPLANTRPAKDELEDTEETALRALEAHILQPFMMANHSAISTTIGAMQLTKTPQQIYTSIKTQLQVTPTVDKILSGLAELTYHSRHHELKDYADVAEKQLHDIRKDLLTFISHLSFSSVNEINSLDPFSLVYTPMQVVVNQAADSKNNVGETIIDTRELTKIYSPLMYGYMNKDPDNKEWYYSIPMRDKTVIMPHPKKTGLCLPQCRHVAQFYRLYRGGHRFKVTTDSENPDIRVEAYKITDTNKVPDSKLKNIDIHTHYGDLPFGFTKFMSHCGYPSVKLTDKRVEFCVPHSSVLPWVPMVGEDNFAELHPHVYHHRCDIFLTVTSTNDSNDFFLVEEAYADDVAFCEFDGPPPFVFAEDYINWTGKDETILTHEFGFEDFKADLTVYGTN